MPEAELYDLARTYRPEFPIFRSAIYLNSCSLGALSGRSRAALAEFADLWSRLGASAWYEHWLDATAECRAAFARLIGVAPDEIALAPSISAALSTVTSAIDFGARPRVVTTELDFPTVVYGFLARRPRGVEVVVLPSPDGVSVPVESFAAATDRRTALIATSHVYFTTGAVQDVAALARIAHEHGALCLIDAYQSTGQIPVDARELGVDVLLSGALKWLLGGPGLAFAYVRRSLATELEPTIVSWFGVEEQFEFDPRALSLAGDARRFELGTPAVPTVYTARAGTRLLEEAGTERVYRRVGSLKEDLIARARGAGLRVLSASSPEARSAIVMVEVGDAAVAVERLAEAGIIVDHRSGAVRLSPHFYNTTEDNARVIAELVKPGA